MYEARELEGVTVIVGAGELGRAELSAIAAVAAAARAEGRVVVIDLARVTHLHYAGAAHLRALPGLRATGASGYVRDLVRAGGAGACVEFHRDLEDALRAA